MNQLEISKLGYRHHGSQAGVSDITFSLSKKEFCCLLGPSGSGKSTLLKLIAGLLRPQSGSITYQQKILSDETNFVAPENRKMGFVFQDGALFPHLSTEENIRFGLRHLPKNLQKQCTDEWLERVGLANQRQQFPHQLSGGQIQRVALARALAPKPEILLLDEPFSGLDAELRFDLGTLTKTLCQQQSISVLLVTHDCHEATTFGDSIAVMNHGVLLQKASTFDVYHHPSSLFVMQYLSPCLVSQTEQSLTAIRKEHLTVDGPGEKLDAKFIKYSEDNLGRHYAHFETKEYGNFEVPIKHPTQTTAPSVCIETGKINKFAKKGLKL